ncbi:hypothetical protein SH661x_001815 [Planctomicrobium sp. SH661]|uniref:hypothetical protein n=1 Tax=Planctomicrobium sp. SH661 TaxID=3448124 RepID=UPI003F5B2A7F
MNWQTIERDTEHDTERAGDIVARVGELIADGIGPTETAARINAEFGTEYSPREIWNLWIDGEI